MTGQIDLNSAFGKAIQEVCSRIKSGYIVEIGTWNGLGSTKCVLNSKNKDVSFISVESNESQFAVACQNLKGENVSILYGRVANLINDQNLSHVEKGWLSQDLLDYQKCPNVLDKIPKQINILLLDGGEFTSRGEFHTLRNRVSDYFILDDTQTRKNRLNRSDLLLSHELIYDNQSDRNGWSIFKVK